MAVVHNVPCSQGPKCRFCFKAYWMFMYAYRPEKLKEWEKYHKDKRQHDK